MKNSKKIFLMAVLCLSMFSISGCGNNKDTVDAYNQTNKFLQENIEINEVAKDGNITIYEIKNNSDLNFVNLPISYNLNGGFENSYSYDKKLDDKYFEDYQDTFCLDIPSKKSILTKNNLTLLMDNKNFLTIKLGEDVDQYKNLATDQVSYNTFVNKHISEDNPSSDYQNVSIDYVGPSDYVIKTAPGALDPNLYGTEKQLYLWKFTNNTDKEASITKRDITCLNLTYSPFYEANGEGRVYEEESITIPAGGSIELGTTNGPEAKYYYTVNVAYNNKS